MLFDNIAQYYLGANKIK